jgi:multidrug efflux pump subunit AcrA (membrane-fusion protein)
VVEAEAARSNAAAELRRYQALYAVQLTAREQVETRDTAMKTAEARLEIARRHWALVKAGGRADQSPAGAKTSITAPISGVVLRRRSPPGSGSVLHR